MRSKTPPPILPCVHHATVTLQAFEQEMNFKQRLKAEKTSFTRLYGALFKCTCKDGPITEQRPVLRSGRFGILKNLIVNRENRERKCQEKVKDRESYPEGS